MAIGWIVTVIALVVIHLVAPQSSGFLALTQILEPWLVVTALIAVPFALSGGRASRVAVGLVAVVLTVNLVGGCVSVPVSGVALIDVAAWNIEWGSRGADRVVEGLQNVDTTLVALEELQPNMAARIDADPSIQARWPYRALGPDPTVNGVGLLSRWPIVDQLVSHDPPYLRAVVEDPDTARQIVVFVVHPTRGVFKTVLGVAVSIDTTARDAAIAQIRDAVALDMAAGRTVLVMGDINTTDREPAYSTLTDGLRDAQRDAGLGPGMTWRPDQLKGLPFGVLRIDYVFSTSDLRASTYGVTCTPLSDHCIVLAGLRPAG